MPELPQLLLLIALGVALVAVALLTAALLGARRELGARQTRRYDLDAMARRLAHLEAQSHLAGWITQDFLLFMRRIHGPIKVREIPGVLAELIEKTFAPEGLVILIRRKPAVSDPGREHQLVVALSRGTRVPTGGVIDLGEGDMGYVAQKRRAMDRRELDQTPSATGDAGALAGFHPELAVPMAVGSKTLGAVGIGRPRRDNPRPKELLDLIAQTAALALDTTLVLHRIRTAASADPLTGIYNKGALAHRLDELIAAARDDRSEVSVFLFDLDHFKNYNDRNGHVAGDELLRLLASLISDEVRTDDVFGRFGGEEFLLILPGRSLEEAEMTAGKLLRLVRGHDFPGAARQPLGRVTISGGVAAFPENADSSSDLVEMADQALYRAKQMGRDRVMAAGRQEPIRDRPVTAELPLPGSGDDLKKIRGIGPAFEKALKEIGISTYREVAELNWTRMVLVASRLGTFPERIVRDRWLQQARELHLQKHGEGL